MLRIITSATPLEVRGAAAFAGLSYDAADRSMPTWAETVIEGGDVAVRQVALALGSMGHRIDAWRPRPIVSDPTFAMAAASIDRTQGGGFGSPAPVYVR